MNDRPRIGLCAAVDPARTGPWNQDYDLLPRAYTTAVQRAGGLAVMIPADEALVERPDEALALLDGLVLAGGSDIGAGLYGGRPHRATSPAPGPRDEVERTLGQRAVALDLPLLGICRGMQMLNVIGGGTLDQHLPDTLGHERHCSTPGVFDRHGVQLERGSLAAAAIGGERHHVYSHHHQGVDRIGERVSVSGRSGDDGVVEAIEISDRRFVLGVLWHPEEEDPSPIFDALIEAARPDRKTGRDRGGTTKSNKESDDGKA